MSGFDDLLCIERDLDFNFRFIADQTICENKIKTQNSLNT